MGAFSSCNGLLLPQKQVAAEMPRSLCQRDSTAHGGTCILRAVARLFLKCGKCPAARIILTGQLFEEAVRPRALLLSL